MNAVPTSHRLGLWFDSAHQPAPRSGHLAAKLALSQLGLKPVAGSFGSQTHVGNAARGAQLRPSAWASPDLQGPCRGPCTRRPKGIPDPPIVRNCQWEPCARLLWNPERQGARTLSPSRAPLDPLPQDLRWTGLLRMQRSAIAAGMQRGTGVAA